MWIATMLNVHHRKSTRLLVPMRLCPHASSSATIRIAPMAAMQPLPRLQIRRDTPAIWRRAPRRGAPRDESTSRGLVVVAHIVSLLSVGALVIGLTFGSVALVRHCIGTAAASVAAAAATDDGGGSRTGPTEVVAGSPR
jgi:hypothetical protein